MPGRNNELREKKDEIIRLYLEKFLSPEEIGRTFGCSGVTITAVLKENNSIIPPSERRKILIKVGKIKTFWEFNKDKSTELKKNLSEKRKKLWLNPDWREKTTEKIRIAIKTKRRDMSGINSPMYGRKMSEENLRKLREFHSNKSYIEKYGPERASDIKRRIGEKSKKWHAKVGMSEAQKEKFSKTMRQRISEGKIRYDKQREGMIGNKLSERKDLISHFDEIQKLYEKGLSANTISKKFNSTSTTIINLLKKKNIQLRGKSFYMAGERHPMFNNWSSFEPYTPNFNKQFKEAIRIRDAFLCLKCGMREEDSIVLLKRKLAIHHIDYIKENTFEENCCALCSRCNSEVNINRPHWTKFFQSLLSERYDYKYDEKGNVILELTTAEEIN